MLTGDLASQQVVGKDGFSLVLVPILKTLEEIRKVVIVVLMQLLMQEEEEGRKWGS